jgi:hypothetical protein
MPLKGMKVGRSSYLNVGGQTLRFGRLSKKLRGKYVGILVVFFLLLFSLRVITWFEYPYVLISGDFRPPLVQEAFTKRVMYTWDETDFGLPSVYPPRILVPSYFFMSLFQTLGVSLYMAEMMALFILFFLTSVLMFVFARRLLNGNAVASFVAALYLTSNLYMINDREVTATAFLDTALVILPFLIALTVGITEKSYKSMALAGILFVLAYGSFPNFRVAILCLIAGILISIFVFMEKGLKMNYQLHDSSRFLGFSVDLNLLYAGFKYVLMLIFAAMLASVWILALIAANFGGFFQVYQQMGIPQFILNVRLADTFRLITKWGFYSGGLGVPYIPYANVYLSNPLIVFASYVPTILAFASLLISKSRRVVIFFSAVAVIFIGLSSGFNPYFSQLYLTLAADIPFLIAFRESAQWSFFVVLSFSLLIGVTFSVAWKRLRRRIFQIFVIGLAVMVLLVSSYPLTTGDVARNWLDTSVKGSLFPASYVELNNMLSDNYWTLLLPQRNTYVVYNFSGIPFNSGNPYPLVFSKPVISGLGTEYLQSNNLNLVNKLNELMQLTPNLAPLGTASASSIEAAGFEPGNVIDGSLQTRWSSGKKAPQWLEVDWRQPQQISELSIQFEWAYAVDYLIQTWNGSRWVTQVTVQDNTLRYLRYSFPDQITTSRLRLYFTKTTSLFPSISIWELAIYKGDAGVGKLLGMLGIKYVVLEKDIVSGNTYDISNLDLKESSGLVLAREWNELSLYNNTFALQKIYASGNMLQYTTLDDMAKIAENMQWKVLQNSVFTNSLNPLTNGMLVLPDDFDWTEQSPTSYKATVQSKGSFVLTLLESYDPHWKLYVNGSPIGETDHLTVNSYANGWLIRETGKLAISIDYETQSLFTDAVIVSVLLPVLLLLFLSRRELKANVRFLWRKFMRKESSGKAPLSVHEPNFE